MNKTRIKRVLFIALAIAGLLVTACKKKEIQGPKGETGDPGGGGNAGINSTNNFYVTLAEWKPNKDSTGWKTSVYSPLLTQSVVDKGSIKVYMNTGAWSELPYIEDDLFTQYSFVKDTLKLTFGDMHGNFPERPTTRLYRLVTVSEAARMSYFTPGTTGSEADIKQLSINEEGK